MRAWQTWLMAWAELIDALSGILSLGYWHQSLSYRVCLYFAMQDANKALKESNCDW